MPRSHVAGLSASQYTALVRGLQCDAVYKHQHNRYTLLMANPLKQLTDSQFPRPDTESWMKRLSTMESCQTAEYV